MNIGQLENSFNSILQSKQVRTKCKKLVCENATKFNLAIDDGNIDFNISRVHFFFLTRCVDEQKQSRNQSTDKLTQRLNQICHIWRWAVNPCEATLGGATREHANERAQATGPPSSPRQCCRVLHGGWYLSSPIHS